MQMWWFTRLTNEFSKEDGEPRVFSVAPRYMHDNLLHSQYAARDPGDGG
jgi:hypothetical protein